MLMFNKMVRNLLCVTAIMFCIHSLLSVSEESLSIEELLSQADYHISFADYQAAEPYYRNALSKDKTNLRAIEGLLYSLMMQQKFQEIISVCKDLQVKPVSARLYDAYSRYMTADYIGSLNAYKAILREEPDNDTALAGLGWNYTDLGYYTYALKKFNQALDIDSTYFAARDGVRFAENMRNYFYAQLSWLDKENVTANPSTMLYLAMNSFNAFIVYDFFFREVDDVELIDDEDFYRSSVTGGFRYLYDRFILGVNLYYLTGNSRFMYDGRGFLTTAQSNFLLPFAILDLGLSAGMSEYKFGKTEQYEIYGNLHFNTFSIRGSVMNIELEEKADVNLVDNPSNSIYSFGADYYFNREITVRGAFSIGERMLMMNKNGYIVDKYNNLPEWELELSLLLTRNDYLLYLGSKYDELDTLTIYGGAGITIKLKR